MSSDGERSASESPERRVYEDVLARIEASGAGAGDPVAAAEEAAKAAEAAARTASDEVTALKAAANGIKREIAEWKGWWAALPPERAPHEVPKLQIEVARLAARLAAAEAVIAEKVAAQAHGQGVALAMRARAAAIAAHGPQAEAEICRSLDEGLRAALAGSAAGHPPDAVEPGRQIKSKETTDPAAKGGGNQPATKPRKRKSPP